VKPTVSKEGIQHSRGKVTQQSKCGLRLVQLVSMSHYRTVVNARRRGRRTALEIKALYTVFQYNKFMMGVDMADKYLRYHLVPRNTVKWPNLSAKLCIPQCNIVY